jgi:Histidine kinase
MRLKIPISFVFLLLAVGLCIYYFTDTQSSYPYYYNSLKVFSGDSSNLSDKQYNDKHWPTIKPGKTHTTNQWWLRVHLTLNSKRKERTTYLATTIHGSYDVYLNGVYIGSNGKLSNILQNEAAGKRTALFLLPDSLLKTDSLLFAFRISSLLDRKRLIFPQFFLTAHAEIGEGGYMLAIMQSLGGIFFVISIYFFLLYFVTASYKPYLLFAVLCTCFFLMETLEYIRYYYNYPYHYHFIRLLVISALSFLTGIITSWFILLRFDLKHKQLFILLLFSCLLLIWLSKETYDDKAKTISVFAFTYAAALSFWAILQKKEGSVLAFYGIIFCLSCHVNYDITLYAGFAIFILFILLSLSIEMKKRREAETHLKLRSKWLEIELLKKNIQPHFLMNSLTSLMEWVERDSAQSVSFIEALAGQFRMLNEISSNKLIPVNAEINLCKSYLQIMSYRKDRQYLLTSEGIDERKLIPPAIFLTVLENGITHNFHHSDQSVITFHITERTNDHETVYEIFSPGNTENYNKDTGYKEGTGIKYIKARLEESYFSNWEFSTGVHSHGWLTKIILKH